MRKKFAYKNTKSKRSIHKWRKSASIGLICVCVSGCGKGDRRLASRKKVEKKNMYGRGSDGAKKCHTLAMRAQMSDRSRTHVYADANKKKQKKAAPARQCEEKDGGGEATRRRGGGSEKGRKAAASSRESRRAEGPSFIIMQMRCLRYKFLRSEESRNRRKKKHKKSPATRSRAMKLEARVVLTRRGATRVRTSLIVSVHSSLFVVIV